MSATAMSQIMAAQVGDDINPIIHIAQGKPGQSANGEPGSAGASSNVTAFSNAGLDLHLQVGGSQGAVNVRIGPSDGTFTLLPGQSLSVEIADGHPFVVIGRADPQDDAAMDWDAFASGQSPDLDLDRMAGLTGAEYDYWNWI